MARKGNNRSKNRSNGNVEGTTQHVNRQSIQNRTGKGKIKGDRHESRQLSGEQLVMSERAVASEDYKLDWFKPTEAQKEILYSIYENELVLVQASSGTGKSTTAIWYGLSEMKKGNFKKLMFIKSATESSDDSIGYLPSDINSKLMPHLEASRGIFTQFMSVAKLEMEEKRGRIEFKIPNFVQGATFDNTLMIIDESQQMSSPTLKLLMERAGENSRIILLGDRKQCYATKKRQDGFTFFKELVTDVDDEGRYSKIDNIGYVEMPASANMRSALSRLVVSIFEETDI